MSTHITKPGEVVRRHYVVDAEGQVLGRLASKVASVLRGKHKVVFSPSVDAGDFVIVVNAAKVRITGKKLDQHQYFSHSGYPGAARYVRMRRLFETSPDRVVRHAVKGMLPKNKLGRRMLKKLRVYAGPAHPHEAQKPEPLTV
jgi:large subunit ribosomal protein L13